MSEERIIGRMVCKHYGCEYVEDENIGYGFWNRSEAFKNLNKLSEILDPEKKIRVIFEYDPDFPKAYVKVKGHKIYSFDSAEKKENKMKSYKEISEMLMGKIEEMMKQTEIRIFNFCQLVDSWIAYAERDTETPEKEKHALCEKLIGFIEEKMETMDMKEKAADRIFNLAISEIQLREMINPPGEDQKKARTIRLTT